MFLSEAPFSLYLDKYFKTVCLINILKQFVWPLVLSCETASPLTPKYLIFQKNQSPPNQVPWRVHLKALIHLQLTKVIIMWWVIFFFFHVSCYIQWNVILLNALICTKNRQSCQEVPKLDRDIGWFSYKQDRY